MQIAKYVSSKETINNFFRNTGVSDRINYGDAAYWIYECMELIGTPLQYIPKVIGHNGDKSYDLESYRLELPADFHKLIAVSIDGILALPSQNLFHQMLDGSCCGYDTDNLPSSNFYDNFGNVFSPQALPFNTRQLSTPPTFTLNSNYITFDVKDGKVCMAYMAFPLDEEGFPLIPDNVKYKRAVAQYIQWKYDYIQWRQKLLPNEVYMESKQEYEWAIASARAEMLMPDLTQMESLRRSLTKMVVRTEDFQTAFSTMNSKGFRGRY